MYKSDLRASYLLGVVAIEIVLTWDRLVLPEAPRRISTETPINSVVKLKPKANCLKPSRNLLASLIIFHPKRKIEGGSETQLPNLLTWIPHQMCVSHIEVMWWQEEGKRWSKSLESGRAAQSTWKGKQFPRSNANVLPSARVHPPLGQQYHFIGDLRKTNDRVSASIGIRYLSIHPRWYPPSDICLHSY